MRKRYHPCPVCGKPLLRLKRHLVAMHGWRYTKESPEEPLPPKEAA